MKTLRRIINEVESTASILAFDIGGTRIKAGIVRDTAVSALHIESLGPRESTDLLIERLMRLVQQIGAGHHIQAIGISMKGIVDPQQGLILDVNEALMDLIGQPLAQHLADASHLPVVLENDARMYLLGEMLYGAGKQAENLLCLTLGTGVGSGVALQRRVLRGPRGLTGILGGHLTIQKDGPRCTCGNIGCLEALIGTAALVRAAVEAYTAQHEPMPDIANLTPQAIFTAARSGYRPAQMVIQSFTHALGAGIVSLVHAYDPDYVVLGGGLSASAEDFLPLVQAYLDEHIWSLPRGRVRVLRAELGDAAALLGIAAFARGFAAFL